MPRTIPAADQLLELHEEKYKLLADNPHTGPARPDIAEECGIPWVVICCFIESFPAVSNWFG